MQAPRATWHGPWPTGWDVRHVAETGSTNADLMAAAAAGAPHGTVLATDHQTAGRGRLDRRWDAPPGENLLVSILVREHLDEVHRWTQRVALAARTACGRVAGVVPELKWPNDLLVGEEKLAGILAEGGASGGRLDHVVIGIGLNVGWAPAGGARLGTSSPPEVLAALLDELSNQDPDPFPAYRAALATIGRRVRVTLAAGELTGTAIDVRPDGTLVVEPVDGPGVDVRAGDVVHLRVTNG